MRIGNAMKIEQAKYYGPSKMVQFYESLLKKGVISPGSAGYNRLTELRIKNEKYIKRRKYGYKVT